MKSSTIIGGAGAKQRHELDFYETPAECTVALIKWMNDRPETFVLDKDSLIYEPSAGNGAIANVLKEYGYAVISNDISYGSDYLSIQIDGPTAIITNPPFILAEKFIRKAVSEVPLVAMLLKATYFHTQSRVALFRECQPYAVLPMAWRPAMDKSRGNSPTMDFIWAVWLRGSNYTMYEVLERPKIINPDQQVLEMAEFHGGQSE